MHMLRLLPSLLRINLQQDLAYRVDAVLNMAVSLIWLFMELLILGILLRHAPSLGGWGLGDLIVLLGIFRLIITLMNVLIGPNTERFNQGMRDGSLDYLLLQPAPSLFLVSFSRIVVWRVGELLLGVVLIVIGALMRQATPTPFEWAGFGLLAVSGMTVIYSLWIVMMAFTFWFVKFDNNVTIINALLGAGRFPSTSYPVWLRLIVTFVVPVALATTVPVQALRGELSVGQVLLYLLVAAASLAVAWRVWQAGVRRYSSASS